MKKLSEIGRTTTTEQGFRDPDGTVCVTESETTIHYTPAERREFAYACIRDFLLSRVPEVTVTGALSMHVEEFCKEHGL